MNSALARALLVKGVIRQGTVIEAYQNVRGLSCVQDSSVMLSFVISRAVLLNGKRIVFDSIGPDQIPCRLPSEDVVSLDGMLIERIASSHNLALDGTELAARSRRGRRRKTPPLACCEARH
jgi:hypothetical protein